MSEFLLNEVCELIVDCPHTTAKDEGEGFPLVRTPNIGKGRLVYDGMHRVCEDVYNKRNARAIPQENDLIFAREATAGNVALIQKGEKVCLGQRTVLIRPNQEIVNPAFLTYFLLAPKQQYNLLSTANGATVAHVNLPTIRNLKIDLPELSTQHRIATILSRYDSLIENYQKQIKLLEEAAQRLYKEWFVNLHFPGHENTKIVEGVPEGWEKKTINDVCTLISSGSTPSRNKNSYWENGTIRWVKTKELLDRWILDTEEYITQEGYNNSSTKLFPANTILMAIYASPTLGRLGILSAECCCNQAALGLIADEKVISWQWLFWKLYELRDEFNAIARGAGQQNISGIVVKNKEIVIPAKRVIDGFTSVVSTMFEQQKNLQLQIRLLTEARDRLLPKLMSGEIAV
ncbi:MAG: restriction endonuclease subunit S [Prevotella sp.]